MSLAGEQGGNGSQIPHVGLGQLGWHALPGHSSVKSVCSSQEAKTQVQLISHVGVVRLRSLHHGRVAVCCKGQLLSLFAVQLRTVSKHEAGKQ